MSYFKSHLARVSVYALMLAMLFIGAYIPAVGTSMGHWHFQAHFIAFAIVGGLTGWALSCIAGFWQALIIVCLPIVHEVCEISGHHHPLETNDIVVDILGGIAGLIVIKLLKKMWSMVSY